MILYDLSNSESHPAYQALAISNGNRQFDFLRSIVSAALQSEQPFLSQAILKALNFHAIACLHTNAGEFRPCAVHVEHADPQDNYMDLPWKSGEHQLRNQEVFYVQRETTDAGISA